MKLVKKVQQKTEPEKRVLKRSKTGLEVEFSLLDQNGKVSNKAFDLISALKHINENLVVKKEVGKNMIEFGCFPGIKPYDPSLNLIRSLENAYELCQSNDLHIYPFATYPGKFDPIISKDARHDIKKKILGEENMKIAGRVCGFHHHYCLPKGMFDDKTKSLKLIKKSKIKNTLVASYNFEIAVDPVLALFTQSSPFYQGEKIAKDSRLVVYRGGKKLKYMNGLYSHHQQFGALPPYKHTITDLLHSFSKRVGRWKSEVNRVNPKVNFKDIYPHDLSISWNPVKINSLGTLEQRGMDVNFLSILIAVTVLLKHCLKKIQREFIIALPTDFGIEESFKIENDMLFLPPHSYVRNKLQKWSTYQGYNKKEMYNHAKKFFSLAKSVTPKSYNKIIQPVVEMLDNKKSMSDKIFSYAKQKGYLNEGKINNKDAAELALHYSKQFYKDLHTTKLKLEKVSML
ncbi:hypothetical protein ACFL0W_03900 [Nanoarchaeota archaeon]